MVWSRKTCQTTQNIAGHWTPVHSARAILATGGGLTTFAVFVNEASGATILDRSFEEYRSVCHRIEALIVLFVMTRPHKEKDNLNSEAGAHFEELRPRLIALAYRMLGTTADAEDVVQDTYVRFHGHQGEIESVEGWLVRVTIRLCIDRKRSVKREGYIGNWLPEPVPEGIVWMEDRAELAETLSMAFMVLLETLAPVERAAYLLRDVFGYEFDEVAELIEKTPNNARQIVVRARRRLSIRVPRFSAAAGDAKKLAETFFDACRSGELDKIKRMLADDATLTSDGGGNALAAPKPIQGTHRIANLLTVNFRKDGQAGCIRTVRVGRQPAVAIFVSDRPVSLVTLAIRRSEVSEIFVMRNPDKLKLWSETNQN